jgi:hypothetical protein
MARIHTILENMRQASYADNTLYPLMASGAGNASSIANVPFTLSWLVNDGTATAIATGVKPGDVSLHYAYTITGWEILADVSGAIEFDIWKDTYGNYPPTVADTIVASAPPKITASATKAQSNTLTGWTTSVGATSTLRINVNSCTTITSATLILFCTRTI